VTGVQTCALPISERKNVKKLKIKKEVVVDFEILEKKRYEVI
jgi:hypothetical protein